MRFQNLKTKWMQNHKAMIGTLFMLSAALLFTMMSLMVKLIDPRYTIWHLGFIRFFGGLILLLIIFGRSNNLYKGHNIPLLITRGCTGSLAFIFSITAIRILPISTSIVIFYSYPVFAAIFAFFIYKEHIGKFQIACIFMLIIGIATLFEFSLTGSLYGQSMAIVGGIFAGLTVTLIRSLRENNGPVIIYLYFCTMGTLVTMPQFIMEPVNPY